MSNLAKLRANALGHLTSRKFRYPVCLEPEKRAELRKLADLIRTTADAAAARAAEDHLKNAARRLDMYLKR